ncbi:MAG: DUF5667 domain-containing protein [Thermoleophilia bacterium]
MADELKPLLSIALRSRSAMEGDDPAAAKARTWSMISERAQRVPLHSERVSRWPLSAITTIKGYVLRPIPVAAVLVLAIMGTAVAATGAKPDDFLYPVKQYMESARTAISWQELDKAELEADFAQRRLDEILLMAKEGKNEYIPELLLDFEKHLNSATRLAEEAAEKGKDTSEVEALIDGVMERYRQVLSEIGDMAPGLQRQKIENQGPQPTASPPATESPDAFPGEGSAQPASPTAPQGTGGVRVPYTPGSGESAPGSAPPPGAGYVPMGGAPSGGAGYFPYSGIPENTSQKPANSNMPASFSP